MRLDASAGHCEDSMRRSITLCLTIRALLYGLEILVEELRSNSLQKAR